MGMRIDLVDKEKYQVNPRQQRALLIGPGAANNPAVKSKVELQDVVYTEKMLDDLRQKLLSSRDRFILSNKDTLPDFDPQKKLAPGLVKQSSLDTAP